METEKDFLITSLITSVGAFLGGFLSIQLQNYLEEHNLFGFILSFGLAWFMLYIIISVFYTKDKESIPFRFIVLFEVIFIIISGYLIYLQNFVS